MIETEIKGIPLFFETSRTVFSPSGIDAGTLAMLSQADFTENDKVLDLGCGYGVVGILACRLIGSEHVLMSDISEEAVRLSVLNAARNQAGPVRVVLSDGLDQIAEEGFTKILSNPPYHADFSVAKRLIERGYAKLAEGGRLYLVTKRKEWYKNKLISVFGGVQIAEIDGYYVFCSEKRPGQKHNKGKKKAPALSAKLQRKAARMNRSGGPV